MSFIIFETAQKVFILKTDDLEALVRSSEASTAIQHITIHAQVPFGTTDESALFLQGLIDATYTSQFCDFIKQNVPQKSVLVVQDQRLNKQLENLGYKPDQNAQVFRIIRRYAKQIFQAPEHEIYQASRALAHQVSRLTCQFDENKSDQQVMQAIGYYETLVKDINGQTMRLAECIGFHFPELKRLVDDIDLFIVIAYHVKHRKNIRESDPDELVKAVVDDAKRLELEITLKPEQACQQVLRAAYVSTGCEFQGEELMQLELIEQRLYMLLQEKYNVVVFLKHKLQQVAPNTLVLLGTLNAARLIAKAGSLSKLAKAPASTVQLFGAEKALFRVLKRRSNKTPKYGLLFRSNQVQSCKHMKSRGRVARALACCVARCSRVDFYSERKEQNTKYGEAMKKLMEQRVAFYDGTLKGEMMRMEDVLKQGFE